LNLSANTGVGKRKFLEKTMLAKFSKHYFFCSEGRCEKRKKLYLLPDLIAVVAQVFRQISKPLPPTAFMV